MMQKKFIRFNLLQQDESKKKLFLRNSNANFTVILQKKTFQLHKQLLTKSEFFQQAISQNKQSIIIQNQLNLQCFQKILGCFYGIQAQFQRHYIENQILKIFQLLKVKQLYNQLQDDMRKQSDQYGLFNLFSLSKILGMKDVQQKCLTDLINQQFQQINYNKYDLFQLNPQLFAFILKQHQKLKANRSITGLSNHQMRLVCQQYSKTSGFIISAQQIFNYGKQLQKQTQIDSQSDRCSGNHIRRRNATWTNNINQDNCVKKNHQKPINQSQNKNFISTHRKSQPTNYKQGQLIQKQENHSQISSEVKSVGSATDRKEKKQNFDNDDGFYKQRQSKKQTSHKKPLNIKNKVSQIDSNQDSDSQKGNYKWKQKHQKQQQNKKVQGTKQKTGKTLPSFAILKKTSDIYSDDQS